MWVFGIGVGFRVWSVRVVEVRIRAVCEGKPSETGGFMIGSEDCGGMCGRHTLKYSE